MNIHVSGTNSWAFSIIPSPSEFGDLQRSPDCSYNVTTDVILHHTMGLVHVIYRGKPIRPELLKPPAGVLIFFHFRPPCGVAAS